MKVLAMVLGLFCTLSANGSYAKDIDCKRLVEGDSDQIALSNAQSLERCWGKLELTESEMLQYNSVKNTFDVGEGVHVANLIVDLNGIEKGEIHCAKSRLQCQFKSQEAQKLMAGWKKALRRIISEECKKSPDEDIRCKKF